MSIKNVSFIGLGVMGYPMAGHLQKNGYNVTVFNRTESKAKKWVEEHGGQMGKTPNEACLNAEIVFMCVGRDEDIIEVMEGNNGILSSAKGGLTIVDHTTASAEIARTYFTKLQEKNLNFLSDYLLADSSILSDNLAFDKIALEIGFGNGEDFFSFAKKYKGTTNPNININVNIFIN